MDINEIVDLATAAIDDAAAVGSPEQAALLGKALARLSYAALHREEAIAARLAGNIERALKLETASDGLLGAARNI